MKHVTILAAILALAPLALRGQESREEFVKRQVATAEITLSADRMPLAEVVDILRTAAKVDIVIDREVTEKFTEEELQVDIDARKVPLRDFLDFVLELHDLDWEIRHGVVMITTQGSLVRVETRDFPIADLLAGLVTDPFGEPRPDEVSPQVLLEAAARLVLGPEAEIRLEAHALHATAHPESLDALERTLGRLRGLATLAHDVTLVECPAADPTPERGEPIFTGRVVAGKVAAIGDAVRLQVLPLSTRAAVGLRLVLRSPSLATEFVAPTGRWFDISRVESNGVATTILARIDPIEGPAPPEDPRELAKVALLERLAAERIRGNGCVHSLEPCIEHLELTLDMNIFVDPSLRDRVAETYVLLSRDEISVRDYLDILAGVFAVGWEIRSGFIVVRPRSECEEPRLLVLDTRPLEPFLDFETGGRPRPGGHSLAATIEGSPEWFARAGNLVLTRYQEHVSELARDEQNSPPPLTIAVRGPAGSIQYVASSGYASASRLPGFDAWIVVRCALAPGGDFAIARVESGDLSVAIRLEPGTWCDLLGKDLAIRVDRAFR